MSYPSKGFFHTPIKNLFTPLEPPRTLPSSSRAPTTGLGYFVFPPPGFPPFTYPNLDDKPKDPQSLSSEPSQGTAAPTEEQQHQNQSQSESQLKAEEECQEQLRQQRRACEAEEARKGEEEWVRRGGVLRDAQGRRDLVRMQAIKEELKLRETERLIQERWEEYERRWCELSVKLKMEGEEGASLVFEDIPWPTQQAMSAEHGGVLNLSVGCVQEFLMEGLTVRGTKVTKKDRVRSSLLRWHPDKLGILLSRIHPGDIEKVKEGIGVVMNCLHKLNAQL